MRTEIIEKTVYSYDDILLEKNKEIKKNVLEKNREINIYDNWYLPIYEGFCENMKNKYNVDVSNMYFSGFYSQGDGAIFEIDRLYILEFLKHNKLLTRFKSFVNEIKKNADFDIFVKVKQSGRYYHEKSYRIYSDICFDNMYDFETYLADFIETKALELYQSLQNYYEELQSDNAVLETLEINECEFYENGTMA